jgi:hypothetical protein
VSRAEDQIELLDHQIARLKLRRDAAADDSRRRAHWQETINEVNDQILSWQQVAPTLDFLNRDIVITADRLDKAERKRRHDSADMRNIAIVLGVGGLIFLVACLVWGTPPWWLIVMCLLALTGAGGTAVWAARVYQDRSTVVDQLQQNLNDLKLQWRNTVPDRVRWSNNERGLLTEVEEPAFETELVAD